MKIYVNQLGYLPDSSKIAVFAMSQEEASAISARLDSAKLCNADDTCILEKAPVASGPDASSGDYIWHMDFSECTKAGTYYIQWNNETSYSFTVGDGLYSDLTVLLSRALYFQRCGMELTKPHAGKFARRSCHTAPSVLWSEYQKSLVGELAESELKQFDIRGGWHDAGDYGRYTTAAACALAHILYAYRFFPNAFTQSLNIPESGNGIPDILNECRYELNWMLQMQAEDGSVYHKHTTKNHAGFVIPCEDTDRLFLFPPSSMAAASFVATMALASRIYRRYDAVFADRALAATKKSYAWLEAHPEFLFERIPDCHTGEYGDFSDKDERMWAAMELFRCTGDTAYLEKARTYFDEHPNPVYYGWADISGFAGWALLEDELMKSPVSVETAPLSAEEQSFRTAYKELLQKEANHLLDVIKKSGYGVALGSKEYPWGSNLTVLNRAMLLGTAYLLEKNPAYYTGVVRQMDYLLGVNATDYSYVTGVGSHAFCNPHNRITVADGIEETIPGYVSGGANGHPGDELAKKLIAPGTPPMKCYADRWECYSLNEIAIYWNSPAIFVAAFLDSAAPATGK